MAGIGSMLGDAGSFIFGGSSDSPTYDALKRKREIADMLMQQAAGGGGEYRNWGDGVGTLMKALGARMMDKRLQPQEAAEGKSAAADVARIMGSLGPEGITTDALEGLGGATANPYLPPEQAAVARALMRRKVIPGEVGGAQDGFSGQGSIGELMSVSSKGPMAAPGGASSSDAAYQRAIQAKQQFDAQPTDDNASMMEGAVSDFVDGYAGSGGVDDQRAKELLQLINGGWDDSALRTQSGAGGAVQRGAAQGPMVAQADTGSTTDATSNMKLTEGQSKNLNFWNRMDATSGEIDKYAPALMDRGEQVKNAVPMFGNSLVSEDFQRGRRAGEEWLISILRPDTGAAVTPEEWNRYAPTFLPEPGDGPNMIADKTAARQRAALGLKKGLGLAEVMADELAAMRAKAAPAAAAGGDDWRTKDPSTWTDEQLREFTQ